MGEPVPQLRHALYDAGRIVVQEFYGTLGRSVDASQRQVLADAIRRMVGLIDQVPATLACADDVVISITYREALDA